MKVVPAIAWLLPMNNPCTMLFDYRFRERTEKNLMTDYTIPFNRPTLTGREFDYMRDAIEVNMHISGDGAYTKKCNGLLEEVVGVERALLTTSCTHALEMAALLMEIEPGDEVIVPSFTFVSTVNAFVLRGATPVFADVRPDTLNIDERQLESLITPRTKVILLVHYAGVACEMDTIMAIAGRHGVAVVEDNAHGLFGTYKGRNLGTFGVMATQSFHETKNIQCGEGGALLINDPEYVERAEIIREKGTDRSKFFRGQVDKYTWVDVGSSYLPSDALAAFLFAQLEERESIQAKRRRIWEIYDASLRDWVADCGITLPTVPDHVDQAYHMYYMLLPDEGTRDALSAHLKEHGMMAVFHYLPLNTSKMGLHFGGKVGGCPVTEDISARLLRLPFYNSITEQQQQEVVAAMKHLFGIPAK
jgi:dTDP-4-amino-4,6-dideoxygalactose transaminase